MSRRLVFAVPGNLEAATGGYGYDRRVIAGLRDLGWDVTALPLPGDFPDPSPETMDVTRAAFGALADGTLVLVDGLAFGVMASIAAAEGLRLRLVALVHHPLALETGVSAERAADLASTERAALAHARRVVVTSRTTARTLAAEFGVEPGRIGVVPPGTEAAAVSRGDGDPPLIVCVGSLVPRKGQDDLVAALATLDDLPWRCRILGDASRNEAFAGRVQDAIDRAGLAGRIELVGEVADARAEMGRADIFALATRFEGYGMVFAEAMSQGLPIVGTAVGAVPEVVPDDAGLLVPPNDPAAFALALRTLLADPGRRRMVADAALRAAAELPTWAGSVRTLSDILVEAAN